MKLIISLALVLTLISPSVYAEGGDPLVENTKNDLLIVTGAGVGGAVLGLSTLSFYDKPSKHLSNIWMGAALGIIAGVIFVAINHAQKSQSDLSYNEVPCPNFSTSERFSWHQNDMSNQNLVSNTVSSNIWAKNF